MATAVRGRTPTSSRSWRGSAMQLLAVVAHRRRSLGNHSPKMARACNCPIPRNTGSPASMMESLSLEVAAEGVPAIIQAVEPSRSGRRTKVARSTSHRGHQLLQLVLLLHRVGHCLRNLVLDVLPVALSHPVN